MKKLWSYVRLYAPRFLKAAGGVLTRRLWLKLLSLGLALLIWVYIISNTPSLTRERTITDLSVTATYSSSLSGYTLAVATDIASEYQNYVDVTVELPQSQYARLTSRNIRVTPDYTGIRTPGVYEVPLVATTTYGNVTRINPSTVSVTIENLDSRLISVEPVFLNEDTDTYWYAENSISINPQQITVSGPASMVQNVSKVQVELDVSGRSSSVRRSCTTSLVNAEDEPLTTRLLTRSSNSCYVTLDIYPKKSLEVYADPSQLTAAEGYTIDSISFQPASVTVAGESALLNELEYLPLDIPDLGEVSATFSRTLSLSQLDDLKYVSTRSVYMTVNVSESKVRRTFNGVKLEIDASALPAGCTWQCDTQELTLSVTGPATLVNALTESMLTAHAELTGTAPGEHTADVSLRVNGMEDERLSLSPVSVSVLVMETEGAGNE